MQWFFFFWKQKNCGIFNQMYLFNRDIATRITFMIFFFFFARTIIALDLCRLRKYIPQPDSISCFRSRMKKEAVALLLPLLNWGCFSCLSRFHVLFFCGKSATSPGCRSSSPPPPQPLQQNARHANGSRRYHFETQHRLGKMVDPLIQSPFLLFYSHLYRIGHN